MATKKPTEAPAPAVAEGAAVTATPDTPQLTADPASPIPGVLESRPDDAAPTAPAEQLADLVAGGYISHLRVRALKDGFRRAGRPWSTSEETVFASNFTREQIIALAREPQLLVTPEPRAFNE